VLIDYAKKSIELTTSDGKELEYVVETVVTTKGAANRVKLNNWMIDPLCQWLMSFLMSSPRNCQVCHLTETSSL
jgi:hypothetical protein